MLASGLKTQLGCHVTVIKASGTIETQARMKPPLRGFATASGDEITRHEVSGLVGPSASAGQCIRPVGVVFANCSTASVIRRQVAAPS